MLYPCICNVAISCWKSGAYGFVICRGGTDMFFVLGFGRKRPDLKQYRISGLTSCDFAALILGAHTSTTTNSSLHLTSGLPCAKFLRVGFPVPNSIVQASPH